MVPRKPKVFRPKVGNVIHAKFDPKAAWARLYDRDWQDYRARFLRVNKTCYVCGKLASVVDHVTPAQGNVSLFEKLDNHIPLCSIDHNKITAKFDRYYVAGRSIEPKLQYIADERLKRGICSTVKVLSQYRT